MPILCEKTELLAKSVKALVGPIWRKNQQGFEFRLDHRQTGSYSLNARAARSPDRRHFHYRSTAASSNVIPNPAIDSTVSSTVQVESVSFNSILKKD